MTVRSRKACRAVLLLAAVAEVGAGHGAKVAQAQSLRPNVLLIFDTSGSMAEDAGGTNRGEGTNICPAGTTSRIYNLKSALRAALAQVGTDEANFGLMSFPQVESSTYVGTGTCPVGHYKTSGAQTVTIPNRGSTMNLHDATTFPGGCLMSTNSNQTTFGPWFTSGASQVLRVGVTTGAPGATPAATNFDPPDANIPAIYRWIDNVELPTATGAVTNPELHAQGLTPLGRSLFYARMYFDGMVKPNDPRASCRKNVVILITDGAETCDDVTAPDTTFNLTTCSGGAAFEPYHPVAQACQLFRTSQIKTYMITDNGLSGTDLTAADRIAAAGGSTAAIRVSLADANSAKAALVGIIAETVPPAETCNGVDDNCNGQIDEGVKNMCPLDLTGTLKHCAVESANCLDDDCDGQIDEGFPPNACGQGAGCPVPPEVCDGIDNDCDGDVDEGFDVGGSCSNGLSGACRRVGIKECTADKTGVACNLSGAPVAVEVCNGIDDDCNGMIDDGLGVDQGVGVDCGIQGQGCNKGITRCTGGKIVCDSTAQPTAETCNGKDDDCNGLIDDGVFPGVGDSCLCPGLTQEQIDSGGLCRAGKKVCKGAAGVQCDGCVLPQPEICNGHDDDCDGAGDNMAMCPSGFGCREGQCGLLCRPGEFPCPPGYDCVGDYCVPNRCKGISCPTANLKCDNETGSCVPLCDKVMCATGQTCLDGVCLDCNSNRPEFACAAGQRCVNRQCVKDKCAGVKCAANQYCSNGQCAALDCSPACNSDQKCVAGQCVPYKCAGISCEGGQACDYETGTCSNNKCLVKTCPAFCVPATGECTPDPCLDVRCPSNGCWSCETTPDGRPYCKLDNSCGYAKTLAGNTGGGCSCTVGEGGAGSAAFATLILFGMVLSVGRRRRPRLGRLRLGR